MKFVRGAVATPLLAAAGRREGVFMPCAGENRFFHSSTGEGGDAGAAGAPAEPACDFGEYARKERYRVRVTPRETAETTIAVPSTPR